MNRERFEELVGEALDSLPEEFLHGMENIEVVVEDWPSPEDLESAGIEDGDRVASRAGREGSRGLIALRWVIRRIGTSAGVPALVRNGSDYRRL